MLILQVLELCMQRKRVNKSLKMKTKSFKKYLEKRLDKDEIA